MDVLMNTVAGHSLKYIVGSHVFPTFTFPPARRYLFASFSSVDSSSRS